MVSIGLLFLDATQGAEGTEEEFNQLNDRLFPDKDHLHIYLWNNEFTNYYNEWSLLGWRLCVVSV